MQPNPYQTPRSDFEADFVLPTDVVDRGERRALAALVRRYVEACTTNGDAAFDLDNALAEFHGSSDGVVRFAATALADDGEDRDDVLSRSEWDHFQRLLLLLESNRRLQVMTLQHWRLSQAGALAGIVGYGTLFVIRPASETLLLASVPFGLLSMYLFWRGSRRETSPAVAPFGSFRELLSARRASAFHKARYPQQLAAQQRPATAGQVALGWLVVLAGWMLLAPIVLFCQMLPETETQTHVAG